MEYNQPTSAPTQKMTTVGKTGVSMAALFAVLALFGVHVPEGVSGAAVAVASGLSVIVPWIAGYLKRERR